jgi:hypothetical protein
MQMFGLDMESVLDKNTWDHYLNYCTRVWAVWGSKASSKRNGILHLEHFLIPAEVYLDVYATVTKIFLFSMV